MSYFSNVQIPNNKNTLVLYPRRYGATHYHTTEVADKGTSLHIYITKEVTDLYTHLAGDHVTWTDVRDIDLDDTKYTNIYMDCYTYIGKFPAEKQLFQKLLDMNTPVVAFSSCPTADDHDVFDRIVYLPLPVVQQQE